MDKNLEMLLDYNYGRNPNLNISSITVKEVEKLIKENRVICIFGIIECGVTEAWHFIIAENNSCYVLSKSDDEYMNYLISNLVKVDKEKYIEVESRELDFIYSFNNETIIKRYDGTEITKYAKRKNYSLIKWGKKGPYVIVLDLDEKSGTWLSGRYFNNLIDATIEFYRFY